MQETGYKHYASSMKTNTTKNHFWDINKLLKIKWYLMFTQSISMAYDAWLYSLHWYLIILKLTPIHHSMESLASPNQITIYIIICSLLTFKNTKENWWQGHDIMSNLIVKYTLKSNSGHEGSINIFNFRLRKKWIREPD